MEVRRSSSHTTCSKLLHRPSLSFPLSKLEIIFADDEDMFHMVSVPELVRHGILEEHIHKAMNGTEALDHLMKLQSSPIGADAPIMVVLDVRMPGMSGIDCASRIQEKIHQHELNRHVFVVCTTSYFMDDVVGTTVFDLCSTKPFSDESIVDSLNQLSSWWEHKAATPEKSILSEPESSNHGLGKSSVLPVQVIIADDRLINMTATVGLLMTMPETSESNITEAETEDDLHKAVVDSQDGDPDQPLMIVLGSATWIDVLDRIDLRRRMPYLVCTQGHCDLKCSRFHVSLSLDQPLREFLAPLLAQCQKYQ
mmetsp:Transcript_28536/g.45328  ORF Transcript_28536/g.45328 Transcript_28536/m.45328 type:complete len:310 (+) Transcript_28536:23-952(+)